MSGQQQDEGTQSGHCRICDERFVWMNEDEYEEKVARHIWKNHRDQPPDKPLVEPIGGNYGQ